MKFGYADPPYLGNCKLYEHFHPDGRCWDDPYTHELLIWRLFTDYPDGWAMSASSPSLGQLLHLCGPRVRVAAWVKSFCAFKRNVRPAYAWEPVIFYAGRNPGYGHSHPPPERNGKQTTPKDFIVEPITLRKGLTGAKPPKVCAWILDLLNAQPGDTLHDLYPGTGIMGEVARERGLLT